MSEYIDSSGNIVAHYEYSPFGKLTNSSGSKAGEFNHRFSTKYRDAETGLYYYGYRYYSAEFGRWLSRDPIEEKGFAYVLRTPELKSQANVFRRKTWELAQKLEQYLDYLYLLRAKGLGSRAKKIAMEN